jgi:hypothetical protein
MGTSTNDARPHSREMIISHLLQRTTQTCWLQQGFAPRVRFLHNSVRMRTASVPVGVVTFDTRPARLRFTLHGR